jgi:hypothetical protein
MPESEALPCRFVDLYGDLSIVPPGALCFLWAVATALSRGRLNMRSIYGIDTDVGKPLSCGTLIAVCFRNVGELFDTIQGALESRTLFHADIGGDASFLEPCQKLAVPLGRVGGNRLGKAPSPLR